MIPMHTMLLYLSLVLITVSFVGIAFMVGSKFSLLAKLDVASLARERELLVKKKLLKERLSRKVLFFATAGKAMVQLGLAIAGMFRRFVGMIHARERFYRMARLRQETSEEQKRAVVVLSILSEAESLVTEKKFDEAEQKLIDLITLDSKNSQAYRLLAEVYVAKEDYPSAKEVYEHLVVLDQKHAYGYSGLARVATITGNVPEAKSYLEKSIGLDSRNLTDFAALGKIYESLEEYDRALEVYQKASDIESGNPKYIDRVAELAILLRKKTIAKLAYTRLKKTNPENEKLDDLKRRIDAL